MNEYQDVSPRSEADAVANIAIAGTMQPRIMTVAGRKVLLLPDGPGKYKLVDRPDDDVLAEPLRPSGGRHLDSLKSLVEYTAQYEARALLPEFLAYGRDRKFRVVLNPHTGGRNGWGDWQVAYDVKQSAELLKWIGASMKQLTHEQLADWLQDAPGIQSPAKADLLGVVKEFRSSSTGEASTSFDRRTGAAAVQFKGQTEQTELPELKVSVPAFDDLRSPPLAFEVLIRPRVVEGKVQFNLVIPDLDLSQKEAWRLMVQKLREALPEPWKGRVFDAA